MAHQPPLAHDTVTDTQTHGQSFSNRIWDSPYKPHVLNILYLLLGIIFIYISAISHSELDVSFHTGIWNNSVFHCRIFHTEFYDASQALILNGHPWILHGGEVWELYAIGLTMIFSLLLLFEPAEKPGVARILILAGIILLACIAGILCLGWHFTKIYQGVLLFMVLVLAIVDGSMFRTYHTPEYKLLQFFVDIPILISLLLLTFYVGFPIGQSHKEFFSGALAFQLMVGCLLVVLVREHERILEEIRWAPVALVIIVLGPFRQITVLMKERRKAKKATRSAASGSGGEAAK